MVDFPVSRKRWSEVPLSDEGQGVTNPQFSEELEIGDLVICHEVEGTTSVLAEMLQNMEYCYFGEAIVL